MPRYAIGPALQEFEGCKPLNPFGKYRLMVDGEEVKWVDFIDTDAGQYRVVDTSTGKRTMKKANSVRLLIFKEMEDE